jgi:hypothetical protein
MENEPIRKKSKLGHALKFEFSALYGTLETLRSKLSFRSGFDPASEGRLAALLESVGDVAASVDALERAINEED